MDLMRRIESAADPVHIVPETSRISKEVRRGKRRELAYYALRAWRLEYWSQHYSKCAFTPTSLLPDKYLNFLATNAHVRNIADLKLHLPDWAYVSRFGEQLLELLARTDAQWQERQAISAETKCQQAATNKKKRDQERADNLKYERLISRLQERREVPLQETSGLLSFAAYVGKDGKETYVRIDPLFLPVPPRVLARLLPSDAAQESLTLAGSSVSDSQAAFVSLSLAENPEDYSVVPQRIQRSTFGPAPTSYLTKHPLTGQYYVYAPSPLAIFAPQDEGIHTKSQKTIVLCWKPLVTFDYKWVYY